MPSEKSPGIWTNRLRSWGYVVFSIAAIIAIGGYLYISADSFLHLVQVSYAAVLGLMALSSVSPVVNGLINIFLFRGLGIHMKTREGIYLAAFTTLANQLPLPAGLITRGVYLKSRHRLSYSHYLSASLALFFCSVAANGFIGVGILLYWLFFLEMNINIGLLLSFSLMAGTALVFALPLAEGKIGGTVGNWIDQALQGWGLISRKPRLFLRLVALQTGFLVLFAARQWLAFRMLSQDISFSQAMLLSCGSVLTQLVSFAPGGLGVREAIVGAIATALGFELPVAIAAVELDRVIATLVIAITGAIGFIMLGKDLPRRSL